MGIERWFATVVRYRRATALVALVTTFAGVGLVIDRPKGTVVEWLSLPLIILGGSVFAWAVWPSTARPEEPPASLARAFLDRVTFGRRLVPLFPAFGVALVLADITYNVTVSGTPGLQTEDTIVLLAASSLLAYGFVPARFARERDFVFLFLVALNLILVVPLLVARLYYEDFEHSVDVYSWVALAPETSALLSVFGVANHVDSAVGSTAPGLTFAPQHMATQVTVVITTACSGIYSFGIFAAAFIAFVLTEYEQASRKVWLLLGLGLVAAYVANILRMVVIVLVGYYTDSAGTDLQNMLVAHSYAGWIIFLGWVALFWGALFRFLPQDQPARIGDARQAVPARKESTCGICGDVLSPVLPATRCACGAYYHRSCLASQGRCLSCGQPAESQHAARPEGS